MQYNKTRFRHRGERVFYFGGERGTNVIVEEKNLLFSEAKEIRSLGFLSFVPFFLLGVGKCGGKLL